MVVVSSVEAGLLVLVELHMHLRLLPLPVLVLVLNVVLVPFCQTRLAQSCCALWANGSHLELALRHCP